MKTHEFISSGVLEAHILGLASREEKETVQQFVEKEPAISDYLVDLENTVNQYFNTKATTPPPTIRDLIALRSTRSDLQKTRPLRRPAEENDKAGEKYLEIEVNDTHIKVHKYWRPAFITIFVLSKIFLILGLYYYFKSSNLEKEINQLKAIQTVNPK